MPRGSPSVPWSRQLKNRPSRRLGSFPILILALLAAGASGLPAQQPVRIASVEGITEYALPNGLRVLLFPDATQPTITVNITYLVGSRHEAYGETGMAHLLEHLVFKGSPKHRNIPQELTQRGALPNGTTWFDRTNYFETFPATDENLDWALDLEADRMVNSVISADDLRSEMTVVRNEMEAGENNPLGILLERTLSTAYLWHNYGKSTIGARTYTAEPTQDGERSVTLRRVGDIQLAMAAYHVPPGSHADFPAVQVLSHALGSQPAGRLHKALVETGRASRVGYVAFQLKEAGPLILFAEVRAEQSLEGAWTAMDSALAAVIAQPATDEAVERGRTALLRNIELNFNVPERIALQLSEWASMGDWRLLFLHRDRLQRVTTADVRRVAASYLKPQNRTIGFFRPTPQPDRAEIPAPPNVDSLVRNYTGRAAVAAGEAFDPTPANIESRVVRRTLPSGFKAVLLPKQTRGDAVVVTFRVLYGNEANLKNLLAVGDLSAGMLMRGTTRRTRQEVSDEFDRLKARV